MSERSSEQAYVEWEGTGQPSYPFKATHVGKDIYEGRAEYGTGAWGGSDYGGPGHLDCDGTVQTIMFKVKGNHRPTMMEFYHTDGTNPSTAAYNLYIDYKDRRQVWGNLYGAAVTDVNHVVPFGEKYERLTAQYRIRIQATSGHDVYVTPRFQIVKRVPSERFGRQR